ncbi:hypothetical protein KDW_12340 [Dictyobacter vulcani]|uniref:Bacteriocin n=1 Tax=Dictyobacter vulcani TaxID=2607529 RepID=A0A5J4KJC9_9CHLR|nr:bacteriocin [Dictyobacter vulcani]GER87072.1 hypothetical protein KDW_12340 [Dictyobacter vulcani]
MFKFGKKNTEITDQVMEEVTDEQLSQVSGGSLLNTVDMVDVFSTVGNVTNTATGAVSSLSVSGIKVQAAGASVTTPAIVPGTLLP